MSSSIVLLSQILCCEVVPLGDDGLGDVLGAVVLLLHQLLDFLWATEGQRPTE